MKQAKPPAADYYRRMLRRPPTVRQPAAHLAWVRMMARVLVDLGDWTPNFTTALVATHRSLDFLREYGKSGAYEQTFARGWPHPLGFLAHFLATRQPSWLQDVARCEAWASALRGVVPAALVGPLRRVTGVRRKRGVDYLVVSHDPLETLQHVVGYLDTGMSRAGALLWLLQVDPIYPVLDPRPSPGIVVFGGAPGDPAMRYLPVAAAGA